MAWLSKQISAGIVRSFVGYIIGGFFVMVGIVPQEWIAAFFATPPIWITSIWFRILIILVGMLIIAGLLRWERRPKTKLIQASQECERLLNIVQTRMRVDKANPNNDMPTIQIDSEATECFRCLKAVGMDVPTTLIGTSVTDRGIKLRNLAIYLERILPIIRRGRIQEAQETALETCAEIQMELDK